MNATIIVFLIIILASLWIMNDRINQIGSKIGDPSEYERYKRLRERISNIWDNIVLINAKMRDVEASNRKLELAQATVSLGSTPWIYPRATTELKEGVPTVEFSIVGTVQQSTSTLIPEYTVTLTSDPDTIKEIFTSSYDWEKQCYKKGVTGTELHTSFLNLVRLSEKYNVIEKIIPNKYYVDKGLYKPGSSNPD